MARTTRTRIEKLERETLEAAGVAIDRVIDVLTDPEERRALQAILQAAMGEGPPADDETVALAGQALARMWMAATRPERRLVWGCLPLPRPIGAEQTGVYGSASSEGEER